MQINIFGMNVGELAAGPIQGATVSITGPTNWSGTTNVSGYAKDGGGNSPSLRYGNYTVSVSMNGYNNKSTNFTIPGTSNVPIQMIPIMQIVEIIVSE